MILLLDVVASLAILGGVVLTVLAAYGVWRLPDVLMVLQVQTKPAVLGQLLILCGLALHVRSTGLAATVLLVAVLQLFTAPSGAHMIGRAAYRHGDGRLRLTRDDLDRHQHRVENAPQAGNDTPDHPSLRRDTRDHARDEAKRDDTP